jgi:hypothetical protein
MSLDALYNWLEFSTLLVIVGVILEGLEIWSEIKRERMAEPQAPLGKNWVCVASCWFMLRAIVPNKKSNPSMRN